VIPPRLGATGKLFAYLSSVHPRPERHGGTQFSNSRAGIPNGSFSVTAEIMWGGL
jgi:hypothetical protein